MGRIQLKNKETLVSTVDGTFRTGTVRRMTPNERWSSSMIRALTGSPANPVPGLDRKPGAERIPHLLQR